MRRVAKLGAALIVGAILPSPAAAQPPEPATPELIERALDRGAIDDERANLLRVYALSSDPRLPAAYRSDTPWRGTRLALTIKRELPRMERGPERSAVESALAAPPSVGDSCSTSVGGTATRTTPHFYIQYSPGTIGSGLTIDGYAASLEQAWNTEVGAFRWAAPPLDAGLDSRYHVVVDPTMGPALYGFVDTNGTYAGTVGNNPNTPWAESDAVTSCLGLNADYSSLGGQAGLDATTAHEFNHSLQFGYGALDASAPDDNFVEGAATWMEDEVQDAANDNHNFLYPAFSDSMGAHGGDEYAYWLTFRGLTERFGTNTPGGAEQVMQDYWEIVSREEDVQLDALDRALANKGRTLAGTFHDYAIAARLMPTCGGVFARPFCFEEAGGYTTAAGVPPSNGSAGIGSPYNGSIEDNYAINWVGLPATGIYDVTLDNTSAGGQLRGTIACTTGAGVALAAAPAVVGSGQDTTVPGFASDSCLPGTPLLAITNQSRTADNPASSTSRAYTVSATTAAGAETNATVPATVTEEPPDNGPATPGGGSSNPPAGGTTTVFDTVRPVLSSLKLSRRRFRAFGSGPSISTPRGVRVRYSLSEAATVRIRLQRRKRGRWVNVRRTAIDRGTKGANSFRFNGRWRRKRLAPGIYRLRLVPTDRSKNVGARRTTRSLRIVRR